MLQINIRKNQRTTQDWTIQRNWQHWAHKTKANKNTTRYVSNITIRKQTQITQIRHERFYKQLEGKTNRTSFLCGNRSGHHIMDLSTQKDIIGQRKN